MKNFLTVVLIAVFFFVAFAPKSIYASDIYDEGPIEENNLSSEAIDGEESPFVLAWMIMSPSTELDFHIYKNDSETNAAGYNIVHLESPPEELANLGSWQPLECKDGKRSVFITYSHENLDKVNVCERFQNINKVDHFFCF